jgi:ribonuclease HII
LFRRGGVRYIVGLDEAGRGAWAGPVVAAAVVLPVGRFDLARALTGVRDSKQMTPRQRAVWAERIREVALAYAVGEASAEEVDGGGLLPATRAAMERALAALPLAPEHLFIDHLRLPGTALPQTVLIHGDARSLSIAAASVLAKTARDRLMLSLDDHYPGYGFQRNKGYGTAEHRAALRARGPCAIHRFSYAPLARRLFA